MGRSDFLFAGGGGEGVSRYKFRLIKYDRLGHGRVSSVPYTKLGMSLTLAILTYRHYVNMSIYYIDKFDMSILCQYMSL